uniref:Uteroglobin n=1 Tax=Loxodonta africana TaxID=9785 RepID=G5E7C8_LOXAF
MQLSISLLLVTLALCCYEANALVCPSLLEEETAFLLAGPLTYKLLIESYRPPSDVVEAKLQLKQCIDQLSFRNRLRVMNILEKIVLKCNI